ncbi:hypothetical protein [Sporosalibacterium faouarense]|uniref:hypothetical protein n=1 Tax=Sporosalibacterium faouarense TaxID=516123 RepID=UPI00141C469A|nr:hypothetical protein [Sporosalibacterium faouarense]MTI48730.1 hypothetical protein [Bacillota bacterium]
MTFQISEYLFILPLFLVVVFIIQYFTSVKSMYRVKTVEEIREVNKKNGMIGKVKTKIRKTMDFIGKYTTPPQSWKVYKLYKKLLGFTKFKIEDYFAIKTITIIFCIFLIFLIRYTNISIYTREIIKSYDYKVDVIYEQDDRGVDKDKALEEEIYLMDKVANMFTYEELMNEDKVEESLERIRDFIISTNLDLELPSYTVANKIYYRLQDYYSIRKPRYKLYFLAAVIIFFLYDISMVIYNIFAKASAKTELRFLRKLIILNGNFNNVKFNELLSLLIDKSKYYKRLLQEIEEANNKNTVENEVAYRKVLSALKDDNARLFFEKLEQANNSNFEYAIKNIEEEEELEKEERNIKIDTRVEAIHSFGVSGAFIIIYLLVNYLLLPWLQSYDITSFY